MSLRHVKLYIQIMKFLGYTFVSLNQIARKDIKGKYIALVADDAYKCIITNLMPILITERIPCTLFVPPGLLGLKANDSQLKSHACYADEDMMDWNDVKAWIEAGFEIGYHTNMHIDLSKTSMDALETDFNNGLESLSAKGYVVDKFAYPFGRLPINRSRFEKLLANNGFKYAYTLWPDDAVDYHQHYVPRICLGDHTPTWWNVIKSIGLIDHRLKNKCEYEQRI